VTTKKGEAGKTLMAGPKDQPENGRTEEKGLSGFEQFPMMLPPLAQMNCMPGT